uniref:Uncharacterized protein n=1 Tax=Arundo donax TaxID=35708 RepID=A0A0A9HMZ9_ARUDO
MLNCHCFVIYLSPSFVMPQPPCMPYRASPRNLLQSQTIENHHL